jgi:hypothetical protein
MVSTDKSSYQHDNKIPSDVKKIPAAGRQNKSGPAPSILSEVEYLEEIKNDGSSALTTRPNL